MANRQMVELECRNNCAANRRRVNKCKARSRLLELALSQKMYVMSGEGTVGLRVSQEPSLETSLDRIAHLLLISMRRESC
jgi:hypothetical protein